MAIQVEPLFSDALDAGASKADLGRLVHTAAQESAARATLLGVREGPGGLEPDVAIADSAGDRSAPSPSFSAASAAITGGHPGTAVEGAGGGRIGETAIAIPGGGAPPQWVLVLSSPLADVDDNVSLIQRQILIAGTIALALALFAGWLAARAHAQRLRRLEDAAARVADGDFSTPIPDEGSDEVGQLAATLDEMQKRLARLDSARREFIANASHELRTPIFSLGGFLELLEDDEPGPEARADFVRNMRDQIDRLSKLTVELLDLSKLDSDAIEIHAEAVDLGAVAERVVGEFAPAAERHSSGIEVRTGQGAMARADPDRVMQIMRILLDNALTHTPAGTSIAVTAQTSNGHAGLVVSDDGPGVPPQAQERIFERFFTGDRVRGSGLGLAIARELALRMDGDVSFLSHDRRTEFTLTLPTHRGAQA